MKKRLEAELISIAHRILKLKNKSEVDQLYKETQKLYETLSVLKFYQDNFEVVKADVAEDVLEEKLEQHLQEEAPQEVLLEVDTTVTEPTPEIEETPEVVVEEEIVSQEADDIEETVEEEPVVENEPEAIDEEEPVFKPIFELEPEDEIETVTEEEEEITPAETVTEFTPETKKVVIEEFLGENYTDPVFVKPNDVSLFAEETNEEISEPKSNIVTESSNKSIAIGLNDRIGFVKHLFDESNEDFNRVLSQLNTFDSFEEAKNFIDDMVKPDYNNWQGNEDFAERFMELIANKFQ
jgi:hypothetical protein